MWSKHKFCSYVEQEDCCRDHPVECRLFGAKKKSFSDSGNENDGTVTLSFSIGEPEFVYRL